MLTLTLTQVSGFKNSRGMDLSFCNIKEYYALSGKTALLNELLYNPA